MIKAFFLSGSYVEASFWANEWGYQGQDWKLISEYHHLFGFNSDVPVFICGSFAPKDFHEIKARLEIYGFNVFDAQDIDPHETDTLWWT